MRHTRHAVALAAAALLVTPLVAHAVSAPTAPAAAAAASAALPTSWPAVAVEDRLQPWLSGRLTATAATDRLVVMVSGQTTSSATSAADAAGLQVLQTWDKAGIVVAAGIPAQIRAVVGQPGVTYVEGDQELTYQLDTAHQATRSDEALPLYKASDGSRVDGSGVTIAVIDSGIDGTHPMFQRDGVSKVVRNMKNACGAVFINGTNETCFADVPTNDTDTISGGGHGTHVAGIAGGYEVTTSSPAGTALRGAAPGAKLVGLSVGAAIGLLDSNSAMNWVLEHQQNPCRSAAEQTADEVDADCPPIRATNHSYGPIADEGEDLQYDEKSATVRIQRLLIEQGVTPVWAAGNSGGDGSYAATNPPAMDPTGGVLMVASYNDGQSGSRDNALSSFSSRGAIGRLGSYPDVSAPGDLITSACRPTLAVCTGSPSYDLGNYQTISGTSMAAPYVAGVVAQLVQVNQAITPAEVEDLIEDTAYKFTAGGAYEDDDPARNADDQTSFDKGHGLVDVLALLAAQQGLAEPAAAAPVCTTSSPQVVDPAGDAHQVVLVDTPLPSQDSLDVREGRLAWDEAAQALTVSFTVTDLSAGPPAGSNGEYFRFYMTRNSDPEVYVIATRTGAGAASFSLRQYDSAASTPLTGTFDEATSTVTAVLPAADYGLVIPGQTLTTGDGIAVGQLLGQRATGAATLTADTAAGSCPFTLAAPADAGTGGGEEPPAECTRPNGKPCKGGKGGGKPDNG